MQMCKEPIAFIIITIIIIIIILLSKLVQAAKLMVSIRDKSGLYLSREIVHPYRGAGL